MMTLKDLDKELVYYLAFPYSALPDYPEYLESIVKQNRYHCGEQIAVYLITQGFTVIEPIGMSHVKAVQYSAFIEHGYAFWKKRDRKFVEASNAVIVANMFDWKRSVGVTDEVAHAKSLGKKTYLMSFNDGTNLDKKISTLSSVNLLTYIINQHSEGKPIIVEEI